MNIVCILASGVGNRFGSSVPKQYHLVNGRAVIEYTIDAGLRSIADEVIVVANHPYIEDLESKYGVICIEGGKERNTSLVNALTYIKENYDCQKMIVIDAVCPLVTPALMNQYFEYLEDYDAVFTTAKIPTSLGKYDKTKINREDYFMIQSPDAYRFDVLYNCFQDDPILTTPLHLLPDDAKIKYHFGFKNYAKIIYPHDIAVIEALLNEQAKYKRLETHKNDVSLKIYQKMRKINKDETKKWEKELDRDIEDLFEKWGIYEFSVNGDGYSGLVIEGESHVYGQVVMKIYAPFFEERFQKEIAVLSGLKNYHQCQLLDVVPEKHAMLLDRVIPGDYIDFYDDKDIIKKMFIDMEAHKTKACHVKNSQVLKGVLELTENEYLTTAKIDYHQSLLAYLMKHMRKIYHEYFDDDESYVLHGDAYFKNALKGDNEVVVIDPVGYNAPFIFEYMPFFTYEILWHTKNKDYIGKYNELIEYFNEFIDVSRFKAASFVFCIKQIIPSVYEANDGYVRANSYLEMIRALYLDDNDKLKDDMLEGIFF